MIEFWIMLNHDMHEIGKIPTSSPAEQYSTRKWFFCLIFHVIAGVNRTRKFFKVITIDTLHWAIACRHCMQLCLAITSFVINAPFFSTRNHISHASNMCWSTWIGRQAANYTSDNSNLHAIFKTKSPIGWSAIELICLYVLFIRFHFYHTRRRLFCNNWWGIFWFLFPINMSKALRQRNILSFSKRNNSSENNKFCSLWQHDQFGPSAFAIVVGIVQKN